jgi:hypothetical protein
MTKHCRAAPGRTAEGGCPYINQKLLHADPAGLRPGADECARPDPNLLHVAAGVFAGGAAYGEAVDF